MYGLHDEITIVGLCKQLGIHNLVIQDILDVNQRPKFQAFENFNFFTIKSIVPNADLLETEHISFVIGKNYLISFQEQKGDFFEHLRFRLRENVGLLRTRGVDFLLFTLLEAILDSYFKTLQDLEVQSEMLNQKIGMLKLLPEVLDRIESLKRKIYLMRKAIVPIKDFTAAVERGECTFIEPRHQKYFMEIKDLCLTLLDTCETLDKLLEGASNRYFSLQNHKLNEVMKTLTVVSTVFIPLTFLAGILWDELYQYARAQFSIRLCHCFGCDGIVGSSNFRVIAQEEVAVKSSQNTKKKQPLKTEVERGCLYN